MIFKESMDKDQEKQTYSPHRSPHLCWNFQWLANWKKVENHLSAVMR